MGAVQPFNPSTHSKVGRAFLPDNIKQEAEVLKKFLILFLTMNILIPSVFALDFDLSVDEDIRKNYNPTKIEDDASLPVLPGILTNPTGNNELPVANSVAKKSTVQNTTVKKVVQQKASVQSSPNNYAQPVPENIEGSHATLRAGTKINAKLTASISDRTKKGSKITFISKYPVSTTYFTIPSGTVFYGKVVDSHRPQLSGNGGLLVINIDSMIINDSIQPINAYITKAHFKKIFFNNIKGKRRYVKSVVNSIRPGQNFLIKMSRISSHQLSDGSTMILAPFSIASGLIVFGGNAFISPVLGLFGKGDSLYLPGGSNFEIKLQEDVIIYN